MTYNQILKNTHKLQANFHIYHQIHILLEKCSQRHQIKSLNFKKYDVQPILTRSSIENKLFEITKNLDFNKNYKESLLKIMKLLKIKCLSIHGFVLSKII